MNDPDRINHTAFQPRGIVTTIEEQRMFRKKDRDLGEGGAAVGQSVDYPQGDQAKA
jgi:hypothetical protein